jgi:isoamylase
MINAYHEPLNFEIQERSSSGWRRVIDTGLDSPLDVADPRQERLLPAQRYQVLARSVVVLVGRVDRT